MMHVHHQMHSIPTLYSVTSFMFVFLMNITSFSLPLCDSDSNRAMDHVIKCSTGYSQYATNPVSPIQLLNENINLGIVNPYEK